jgi:hypothetical protein
LRLIIRKELGDSLARDTFTHAGVQDASDSVVQSAGDAAGGLFTVL